MKLAILGATGRMGAAITRLALVDPKVQVVGVTSRHSVGKSVPGSDLWYTDQVAEAIAPADVVIDFSLPEGIRFHLPIVTQSHKPYVTGTTGLSDRDMQLLWNASQCIPVLWAPNMSIGITLLKNIVEQLASQLDESFDIEILEMHHRNKQDAPSGTALVLGECAARGRGRTLKQEERRCRTGGRQKGDIGFAALRGGNLVGDCTVIFAGEEEIIKIHHSALTRDMFAKGALLAAKWLKDQPAKMYDMSAVFSKVKS